MSASVFTGWRNVTPGPCTVCGCSDDWSCDGSGNVYCSCETCGSCGMFDGHEIGCPDDHSECEDCPECGATPDDGEPCGTCREPDVHHPECPEY